MDIGTRPSLDGSLRNLQISVVSPVSTVPILFGQHGFEMAISLKVCYYDLMKDIYR